MSQFTTALLLALMLVLGSVPLSAFATNNNDDDDDWAHEGKLKQKHRVWTGDGPPNKKLGKVGDLYIDNTSQDFKIYKKTAKFTWTLIGTLQGPPGGKGDAGLACWDLNENGTKDLDTEDTNGDGAVNVKDCSGSKGDKGDKGDAGPPGPAGPPGTIRAQSCPEGFFVSGIDANGDLICTPLIERPATCTAAMVPGVDLHGCDFHDRDLSGVDLSGADLRGVNLTGADLTGANLSGAILNLANLHGAILTGTNFSGASLVSADLTGTNLGDAIVTGADMTGALLPAGSFSGCLNHLQCIP